MTRRPIDPPTEPDLEGKDEGQGRKDAPEPDNPTPPAVRVTRRNHLGTEAPTIDKGPEDSEEPEIVDNELEIEPWFFENGSDGSEAPAPPDSREMARRSPEGPAARSPPPAAPVARVRRTDHDGMESPSLQGTDPEAAPEAPLQELPAENVAPLTPPRAPARSYQDPEADHGYTDTGRPAADREVGPTSISPPALLPGEDDPPGRSVDETPTAPGTPERKATPSEPPPEPVRFVPRTAMGVSAKPPPRRDDVFITGNLCVDYLFIVFMTVLVIFGWAYITLMEILLAGAIAVWSGALQIDPHLMHIKFLPTSVEEASPQPEIASPPESGNTVSPEEHTPGGDSRPLEGE